MLRSTTRATALLAAAALALTACGGSGTSSGGSGSGGSPATVAQKGGTLRVGTVHDITSFDQLKMVDNESIRAISQITEGLYKTDAQGHLQPWLATGDTASDGGLTHTLALRPGVKFSDGKPLTSKDVAFTLEHAQKSVNWGFIVANIKRVATPDDHTVVLHLKKPSASLHADLALFATGIVPADWGGRTEAQFAQKPVGTGPFMLDHWDRGTKVVLKRNPQYWRKGAPVLDSVELIGVTDDNTRVTQLRGGQIDVAQSPPWPQLDPLNQTSGLKAGVYALARLDTLNLNTKQAPFTDKRIRHAVSLALDRAGMVKASLAGHGKPASSFLAPSVPYYAPVAQPTGAAGIAQAKQLMAQAGNPHPTIQLLVTSGDSVANTIAQVVQQNLGQIGITVKLMTLDGTSELDRTQSGKYTAAISYLTSDILDPDELASFYVATNGFSTFSNPPELAKLAAAGAQETDTSKRADLYAQMQKGVTEDYGFVPVQYEPWIWGVSDRVHGFTVNGTGIFDLSKVGVSGGS
jgi:peptide/nickel transport system substrate-binding protein